MYCWSLWWTQLPPPVARQRGLPRPQPHSAARSTAAATGWQRLRRRQQQGRWRNSSHLGSRSAQGQRWRQLPSRGNNGNKPSRRRNSRHTSECSKKRAGSVHPSGRGATLLLSLQWLLRRRRQLAMPPMLRQRLPWLRQMQQSRRQLQQPLLRRRWGKARSRTKVLQYPPLAIQCAAHLQRHVPFLLATSDGFKFSGSIHILLWIHDGSSM